MKVEFDFEVGDEAIVVSLAPEDATDRVVTGAIYKASYILDEYIAEDGTYTARFGFSPQKKSK